MAAVTISKIRYKRANSQMMERIPAPFTLRMATSFWRRSVSSVMLEYTPNRVMMMLTIAKNEMILKSASNLNGNLNCSKELEHYAS